jgi:2-polyprenyl-6-hydroxyphenyl methylase/3-demethylubiquinone-9 3-methyltransferase
MSEYAQEVAAGNRFKFGANWSRFLASVDERRVVEAEKSLTQMLGGDLTGKRFLDIGCGSGLFSLAARRLGASACSFDYDPQSVECTKELKRRYLPNDNNWQITEGSVLDEKYIRSLGEFDCVYSWGVLHHTGNMWQALDNAQQLVAPEGKLFIAIYNDQGQASRRWRAVKKWYNRLPVGLKWLVLWPAFIRLWGPTMVKDIIKGRPFRTWLNYYSLRGMSPWRDVVDWVGGYPFEVAKPEQIIDFHIKKGFQTLKVKTCGTGHGCNEFVFLKKTI